MLPLTRSLSRLLSVVLLAVLVTPSALPECPAAGLYEEMGMNCCLKAPRDGTSLDADCCAMVPDTPGAPQPTTPAVSSRTAHLAAVAATAQFACPAVLPGWTPAAVALDSGPPADPLYLRLSTIRR